MRIAAQRSDVPRTWRRTALSGLVVGVVLASQLAVPAAATTAFATTRFSGGNRYDTAAKVATSTFPTAGTVLLATGANYPDALAAAFLSGAAGSPILLTTTSAPVPSQTLAALQTLKTKNVVILGGPLAVGDDVASALSATASTSSSGGNLTVTRIAGQTRYDTAAMIATQPATSVGSVGGAKTAFVASGVNFPDALSAGPAGYADHLPILLTDPQSESAQTEQALQQLGITNVLLMGGSAAVSDGVATQLTASGARKVTRVAGANRGDTAARLYEFGLTNLGFKNTAVGLANGANFPDALAGAPNSGSQPTGILLTDSPGNLGTFTTTEVQNHAATLTTGVIYGGPAAVSVDTETAFDQAAGATPATIQHNVSLTSTSVAPGGTLSGTVTNPGSVQSLTVAGCGLTTQPVTLSSGSFSVTIPATQSPGACTLTFTISDAGGTSGTQMIPITVTGPTTPTAGPDLVSASITPGSAADTVTYTFDKNVATSPASDATKFHVYTTSGNEASGVSGSTVAISGTTATVNFASGTALAATVGTVSEGAVSAPPATSGGPVVAGPTGGVALTGGTTPAAGFTFEPDLVSVDVSGLANPQQTVDYKFDKTITAPSPPSNIDASKFGLITQGTAGATDCTMPGCPQTVAGSSAALQTDNVTVRVTFAPVPSAPPGQNTIVRGVVAAGTVRHGASGNGNPLVAVIATHGAGTAFTTSVQLVSAAVTGPSSAVFDFDGPVASGASITANLLSLFDLGASAVHPTSAALSPSNPNRVVASFGSTLPPISIAAVDQGALKAANNQQPDQASSFLLAPGPITAGQTALPQLTRVKITADSSGNPLVAFTFDKDLPSGYSPAANDFVLYDVSAGASHPTDASSKVPAANGPAFSDGRKTVTWGPSGVPNVAGGFTTAQAKSAVVGAVLDSAAAANTSRFPEGSAAVSR